MSGAVTITINGVPSEEERRWLIAFLSTPERKDDPQVSAVDLVVPDAKAFAFEVPELDSAGHPWSAQLHARTRAREADGTRRRRERETRVEREARLEAARVVRDAARVAPRTPPPVDSRGMT